MLMYANLFGKKHKDILLIQGYAYQKYPLLNRSFIHKIAQKNQFSSIIKQWSHFRFDHFQHVIKIMVTDTFLCFMLYAFYSINVEELQKLKSQNS